MLKLMCIFHVSSQVAQTQYLQHIFIKIGQIALKLSTKDDFDVNNS
jgi:hypothetical protein